MLHSDNQTRCRQVLVLVILNKHAIDSHDDEVENEQLYTPHCTTTVVRYHCCSSVETHPDWTRQIHNPCHWVEISAASWRNIGDGGRSSLQKGSSINASRSRRRAEIAPAAEVALVRWLRTNTPVGVSPARSSHSRSHCACSWLTEWPDDDDAAALKVPPIDRRSPSWHTCAVDRSGQCCSYSDSPSCITCSHVR